MLYGYINAVITQCDNVKNNTFILNYLSRLAFCCYWSFYTDDCSAVFLFLVIGVSVNLIL